MSVSIPPINAIKRLARGTGEHPEGAFSLSPSDPAGRPSGPWMNHDVNAKDTTCVLELRSIYESPSDADGVALQVVVTAADVPVRRFPTTCIVSIINIKPGSEHSVNEVVLKEWRMSGGEVGAGTFQLDIPLKTLLNIAVLASTENAAKRIFIGLRFVGCCDSSNVHSIRRITLSYVSSFSAARSRSRSGEVQESVRIDSYYRHPAQAKLSHMHDEVNSSAEIEVEVSCTPSPAPKSNAASRFTDPNYNPFAVSATPKLAAFSAEHYDVTPADTEDRRSLSPRHYNHYADIDDPADAGAGKLRHIAPTPRRPSRPPPTPEREEELEDSVLEVIMDSTPEVHSSRQRQHWRPPTSPGFVELVASPLVGTPQVEGEYAVDSPQPTFFQGDGRLHPIPPADGLVNSRPGTPTPRFSRPSSPVPVRTWPAQPLSNDEPDLKQDVDLSPLSEVNSGIVATRLALVQRKQEEVVAREQDRAKALAEDTTNYPSPDFRHKQKARVTEREFLRTEMECEPAYSKPLVSNPTDLSNLEPQLSPSPSASPTPQRTPEKQQGIPCNTARTASATTEHQMLSPVESRQIIVHSSQSAVQASRGNRDTSPSPRIGAAGLQALKVPSRSEFHCVRSASESTDTSAPHHGLVLVAPTAELVASNRMPSRPRDVPARQDDLQGIPDCDGSASLLDDVRDVLQIPKKAKRVAPKHMEPPAAPQRPISDDVLAPPAVMEVPPPIPSRESDVPKPSPAPCRPFSERTDVNVPRRLDCPTKTPVVEVPVVQQDSSVSTRPQSVSSTTSSSRPAPGFSSMTLWCKKHHAQHVGTSRRIMSVIRMPDRSLAINLRNSKSEVTKMPPGATPLHFPDEKGGVAPFMLVTPSVARVRVGLEAFTSDGSLHSSQVDVPDHCFVLRQRETNTPLLVVEVSRAADFSHLTQWMREAGF